MAKTLKLDELHLSFFIPNNFPDSRALTARQSLLSKQFKTQLQSVLKHFMGRYPSLDGLRITVDR
jgi:hypothetical protein